MPSATLVISAGRDCSVRMWTIQGEFLGIFGQKSWWIGVDQHGMTRQLKKKTREKKNEKMTSNIYDNEEEADERIKIPGDIRRVASATSLRVLNGGMKSRDFKLPKTILRWMKKITARSGKEQSGKQVPTQLFFLHLNSG